MYTRPRFLEELHAIREEMSRQCDYDMDLFAEMIRNNKQPKHGLINPHRIYRQTASSSESLPLTKPIKKR